MKCVLLFIQGVSRFLCSLIFRVEKKDLDNEMCTSIHSGCFKVFVFGHLPDRSASIDVML